jgi:hypothetical protein
MTCCKKRDVGHAILRKIVQVKRIAALAECVAVLAMTNPKKKPRRG